MNLLARIPIRVRFGAPKQKAPLERSRFDVSRGRKMAERYLEVASQSNLWSGWDGSPIPVNKVVASNLTSSRARSRERAMNDPYGRRFLGLLKVNVVGPQGPRLRSNVQNRRGQPDRPASRAIKEAFAKWGRAANCDVSGRLTFREICQQAITITAKDGECFIRKVYGADKGPFGFQIQLIDAELVDVRLNKDLGDGNKIVMGIEVDAYGKAVAYHLRQAQTADHSYAYSAVRHTRVPADQMIHMFVTEAAGQIRGLPWFIAAGTRMKMLHGYTQDAAKAARVGANANLFFKSDGGASLVAGGTEDADGNVEIEFDDDSIATQIDKAEEIVPWDPAYPHQQFPDFVKAMLRSIASALEVPYNSLANDLEGVNYSSIRSGELEVREVWKSLQQWLFDHFCTPIFEEWLEFALLNGLVVMPKGNTLAVSRIAKFRRHSWQGKRWSWIDPLKDMSANEKAIQLKVKTRGEVIEEQGGDPDETWEALQAENEELERLGLGTAVPETIPVEPNSGEDDGDGEDGGAQ